MVVWFSKSRVKYVKFSIVKRGFVIIAVSPYAAGPLGA